MVETLPAAPPPSVAVTSPVSHVMPKPAGIRIRMSLAAVMVGVPASVTVIVAMGVGGSPTTKFW